MGPSFFVCIIKDSSINAISVRSVFFFKHCNENVFSLKALLGKNILDIVRLVKW
jgi:hypothetical protein